MKLQRRHLLSNTLPNEFMTHIARIPTMILSKLKDILN